MKKQKNQKVSFNNVFKQNKLSILSWIISGATFILGIVSSRIENKQSKELIRSTTREYLKEILEIEGE